jgi:RimJ/RimL family protein N-acetyltransferase
MREPDLQPTLTGTLLWLRPMRPDDLEPLYEVARDPLVWAQHPDSDRYRREVFESVFRAGVESGGALVAIDAASGAVIGSSRFYGWDPGAREIAIGYTFLARRCWGGTYNPEMKRLMLGHAFGFARRVWFHVGARNLRSRRAMANIGATLSHEVIADPAWKQRDMAYFHIDAPAGAFAEAERPA